VQTAHVEQVANQLTEHFGFNESDILYVSAKTGKNVEKILESIIHRIPPPNLNMKDPVFKGRISIHYSLGFLVDSWFLKDKGVVTLMQIKSGKVKKGDTIVSCAFSQRYDVFEVAVFSFYILKRLAY
jgi:translation elongation factor EF-4